MPTILLLVALAFLFAGARYLQAPSATVICKEQTIGGQIYANECVRRVR